MKFYATTAVNGKEPLGTEGKLLFELQTTGGGIRRACRYIHFPVAFRLYIYTNFYDEKTFKLVYERK